ncbi:Protein FAR1-RELATED SEQUENCE 5 [Rhynchospora pubera]|uniref:Protein FAR1-RELATED SEQUENCE 5 n=1 Tax=Rhynchospora pubera TaxID=906938 RepID=A0AAV8G698_9POAL|nr:Protein FAR1-RELATED SEQUENCE 5 [Rhynchospora pubera]
MDDMDYNTGVEDLLDNEEYVGQPIEDVEVEHNICPYVGMEFKSLDEAYNFYNMYGGLKGFSIRKQGRRSSRKGVSNAMFVCSKEGFAKQQIQEHRGNTSNEKTPEKVRGSSRTGCKAYLRVRAIKENLWKVTVFHDDHNHDLVLNTPSKKRNLRSQRGITMHDIKIILDLHLQNVGPTQILEYLSIQHGGKDHVNFKKKDVSNVIALDNRGLIGVDVETALTYFRKKQEDDPEFFYAIEADEDGHMKHIFWADGRSRRAYLEFGDVVTFDTTYHTNRYSMPLAPFIGVNHHRHSIFFGMGLLRSENTESFCWLFQTWLKAMYGKRPNAIITDQDHAMRVAIKMIFPNAVHRCCQWHVMRKAKEHLGLLYSKIPNLQIELESVINHSLTVEEFEVAWAALLDKHKLNDNNHLKNMFETRSEWVPAYFRNVFFAKMSTTQRSEGINSVVKMGMTSHTSIYKFVLKFDAMVESIWQREGDEDLKSMNESPQLWSLYQLEVDARQVYTRSIFRKFKELLKVSTLGVVEELVRDVTYLVKIDSNPLIQNWVPESYIVIVDKKFELFTCTCKGFEFHGLLCSHSIKVMCNIGIQNLPSRYILKRWCKNANANVKRSISERSKDEGNSEALQMFRIAALSPKWNQLVKLVSKDVLAFGILEAKMDKLLTRFTQMVSENLNEQVDSQAVSVLETSKSTPELRDPPQSQFCFDQLQQDLKMRKGKGIDQTHEEETSDDEQDFEDDGMEDDDSE